MTEIIKILKKNKRKVVIAGIAIALVSTISLKSGGIRASEIDPEQEAAEMQPSVEVQVEPQQETLGDTIKAAEENAAGVDTQMPPEQPVEDTAGEVANADNTGDQAADTPEAEPTPAAPDENLGKGNELNLDGSETEMTDTDAVPNEPIITDSPVDGETQPLPDATLAPELGESIQTPVEGPEPSEPVNPEAELLIKPDMVLIDPNAEIAAGTQPSQEKTVARQQPQPSNDLDNGTGKSQQAIFPSGITNQGDKSDIRMSMEELFEMMQAFPEDISIERQMVVLKAMSLQGKVGYFWGGKSSEIGWDERWGNPAYVTSAGSKTTGTMRNFGMDCSGYVTWVFNNSAGADMSHLIANGSTNQWGNSEETTFEDALPGDLAFFAPPGVRSINHVGVVVGKDENDRLLIAHCSSSRNGVVVTEAYASGFRYLRTPKIYEDEEYILSAQNMIASDDVGYAYCWLRSEESSWEEAMVGDLVFKFAPEEEIDTHETGVIRRIDEDGTVWISKMPYNTSSEEFNAQTEGYQYVRKLSDPIGRSIMVKPDEDSTFAQDDFIMIKP